MFALTLIRILLALSLVFVLCSSQKSFLKGLLVGALLGHKKANLLNEGKNDLKDIHHHEKEYVPMPVEKEYVPVPIHEGPKYIPIYIVKECPYKKSYTPSYNHHHHAHHHIYEDNKLGDFGGGFGGGYGGDGGGGGGGYGGEEDGYAASSSKYRGTLDGYSESQTNPTVLNKPNLTSGSAKSETVDNNIGIILSLLGGQGQG